MKQQEIIEHIAAYAATGHIDDKLVPYYDQTGRWCGANIQGKIPLPEEDLRRINDSHLPESRRVLLTDNGLVLLTSCYWTSSSPLTIIYNEIKGSVVVTQNASVLAPNLRRVNGHFVAKTNGRIYTQRLEVVGGNFETMSGYMLRAPCLREVGGDMMVAGYVPPALLTVGGRLAVYSISNLEIKMLKRVGSCLTAAKVESVSLPVLESIGGSFLIDAAQKLDLSSLVSIGGDFLAPSVTNIRARCLRSIGGDMNTSSAKGYYHPAIKTGGHWTIYPGAVDAWVAIEQAKEVLRARGEDPYL